MNPLAHQCAAAVAVWRADVATRPAGDWADLDGHVLHTTGLDAVHWNGAHLNHPDRLAFLNPSPAGYGVYAGLGLTDAPPWRVYRAGAS